jgi:glutamate synthase (NADPH/NADH) large chain
MNKHTNTNGLYTPQMESDSCGVGLLCNIDSIASHYIVDGALTMLENMEHRGAYGAEENTGDGAGILTAIPHEFFEKEAQSNGISLPARGHYGVAMFFLPKDPDQKKLCIAIIEKHLDASGMTLLFRRSLPVDNSMIGSSALSTEPDMEQWFINYSGLEKELKFESKLYLLRSTILNDAYQHEKILADDFYVSSFSSKTIVYKGQLSATQLRLYFPDLQDKAFKSKVAIVHSRFSTNTSPKWRLAQPFRCIAHNGEINTIKGNLNWWKAREQKMIKENTVDQALLPVIDDQLSDSGNFDKVAEFLSKMGRSLPQSIMMMMPEAWQNDQDMDSAKKAFYAYHDAIMEPWDGPASICFTNGDLAGAALDRNGLRPSRYALTSDGFLVLGSEAGCLPLNEAKVVRKGKLKPGEILLVDFKENKIKYDQEIKQSICKAFPYANWLNEYTHYLDEQSYRIPGHRMIESSDILKRKKIAFGFSSEDEKLIINTMAVDSKEPIGSMGADIPLAVLSKKPQHISNYFKQHFAQVTNPPIDSLRENFFMSLKTFLGGTGALFKTSEKEADVVRLESPILGEIGFEEIQKIDKDSFRFIRISLAYAQAEGLEHALNRITDTVEKLSDYFNIICLCDSDLDEKHLSVPTLLATACIHHALIKKGKRKQVSLIVEGGDVWETHHFATLISYGADAIYPYMAYQSCRSLAGKMKDVQAFELIKSYKKAAEKGLLKIMAKLGVSTINSYRGAKTFEILGLSEEVVDKCFSGTVSRIGGLSFEDLQHEQQLKHDLAFLGDDKNISLPDGGLHQWKRKGEYHLFNPQSIHLLQHATKLNDYGLYKAFTQEIDKVSKNSSTLRSYLKIKSGFTPISIDQVEPAESIFKRFATGAMSFGSLGYEAHTTLALAMNRIGGKSNSGEGGEDEKRFVALEHQDSLNSAIKQVASGRFGVTINYLSNAIELQIKMAQGAKPGEGGQLPGHKVDEYIAKVRNSTPGVGLISPPPHHDIYSIEDLAQLIYDLKNANRDARISVKLVSKAGVGVIASGVTKALADHILISGADGGTGASPLSSIRHAGLPWELGLSETHQTLVKNKLRDRVVLQTDGQLRTGRDLAIASMLGADEWGIATAALVVEGCILMRKCHLNTCPVGIATQDPDLRERFEGKAEHLINYFQFLAQDLREIMAKLGVRRVNDLIGRTDFLRIAHLEDHWKTKNLDLDVILHQFDPGANQTLFASKKQVHKLDKVLDNTLIRFAGLNNSNIYHINRFFGVKSTDRAVGTMISNEIAKRHGSEGLRENSIQMHFRGSAGQSFAAFGIKGLQFSLEGEANDYMGKGLSGANIALFPDRKTKLKSEENIIVGNVCLYGATSGNVYINGLAGDRFCVRNSGANAVVEGIGDNGCEYMTGGSVIILGSVGNNFGAGMSGGLAYIYDDKRSHSQNINQEMVLLEDVEIDDFDFLKEQIKEHFRQTSSRKAAKLLEHWAVEKHKFLKIFPREYKAVLKSRQGRLRQTQ